MSYNGPQVPVYRTPLKGVLSYEDWRDDAVCDGMDVELFELGDPQGITKEDQWELISWGLKVCAGCPVRASCRNNSNEFDRYWTTRGGRPPEGLFKDSKMPRYVMKKYVSGFKAGEGPERALKETCKRGHSDWRERKGGGRYCATCRRGYGGGLNVSGE